jgi:hypothetical protein
MARYEVVPIAQLLPHPQNYLTHATDQREHLEASLTQHGQYKNVVTAADLTLLAGHGVVDAARSLGHTHIVIQRMPYAPDDPRAMSLLVGDNEIARLAHHHDEALTALLTALHAQGGDAALLGTGFDALMLQSLVEAPAAPGPGVDPPAPPGFPSYDATLETDYCCPKCGYEWSGTKKGT